MAEQSTIKPQPYWNAGYSFENESNKLFEVCGHKSEVWPCVMFTGEEDDDGNIFQVSLGVDYARKLAKLLLKVADEVDARPKKSEAEVRLLGEARG